MKKAVLYLTRLLPVLLLFFTTACSDSDETNVDPEVVNLRGWLDGSWSQGDEVGVFMLTSGGDVVEGADNVKYVAQPQEDDAAKADLVSSRTIYYPESGSVDFVAYHPYKSTVHEAYGISVDLTDQDNADLLYAMKSGVRKSSAAVELQFEHMMNRVTLSIRPGQGLSDRDIKSLKPSDIVFSGMPVTAELSLLDGKLSAGDNTGKFSPAKVSTTRADDGAVVFSAIVVPQNAGEFTDRTVTFDVGDKPVVWTIPDDHDFEADTHYLYPLTVGSFAVIAGERTTENWDSIDEDPDYGEAEWGIYTPRDLIAFAAEWNSTGLIANENERKAAQNRVISNWSDNGEACGVVRLQSDLDMAGVYYTPIGGYMNGIDYSFTGSFDGGGHTISNLTVNANGGAALFGHLLDATVCNVNIVDCDITAGTQGAAAIAGYAYGLCRISNCHVAGGSIKSEGNAAAGIVGWYGYSIPTLDQKNYSIISGCSVTGTHISTTSTNPDDFNGLCGGIAGISVGNIYGCRVSGVTIVSGTERAGGISGDNGYGGVIAACIVEDTDITAPQGFVGGLTGVSYSVSTSYRSFSVSNISSPNSITGAERYTGVLVGYNGWSENTAAIIENYWASGILDHDLYFGIGSYGYLKGGGMFDKGDLDYFTASSECGSPIEMMNDALSRNGINWRWKEGNAESGGYPIAYEAEIINVNY